MSTIAAGTTTNQALVTSGDTTGNLVFTVNNTTVAFTLNTSGAFGVGASPSYGSSGSILTSGGSSAAPSWTAVLPAANGGTSLSSVGTAGNVLTSNGSTWVSQAVAGSPDFLIMDLGVI